MVNTNFPRMKPCTADCHHIGDGFKTMLKIPLNCESQSVCSKHQNLDSNSRIIRKDSPCAAGSWAKRTPASSIVNMVNPPIPKHLAANAIRRAEGRQTIRSNRSEGCSAIATIVSEPGGSARAQIKNVADQERADQERDARPSIRTALLSRRRILSLANC